MNNRRSIATVDVNAYGEDSPNKDAIHGSQVVNNVNEANPKAMIVQKKKELLLSLSLLLNSTATAKRRRDEQIHIQNSKVKSIPSYYKRFEYKS